MSEPVDIEEIAAAPAKLERWRGIQVAALALFERYGYAAVSIEDIAAASGVSRRTFFNYFDSKAAVLFDPDPAEPIRLRQLLEASDPKSPWESLTRTMSVYLEGNIGVAAARRRILAVEPALGKYHTGSTAHFEDSLRRWLLAEGADEYRSRLLTALVLAVVRQSFISWNPDDGASALQALMREGFEFVAKGTRAGG